MTTNIATVSHYCPVIKWSLYLVINLFDACSLELEISDLELELAQTKEQLNASSDDLRILIRCFKESHLYLTPAASPSANQVTKVRRQEVWFGEGYWRIMQDDGQLDIADVNVEGFNYSKVTTSDNSWAHRLELNSFSAHNLLPYTPYKDALCLHDPVGRGLKIDKSVSLRVYSVGQPPVGGIPVNKHFEINVSPLAVRITHRFYNSMMKFFFPDKSEPPNEEELSPALQALKGIGYVESRVMSPSDAQVATSLPSSQVRTTSAIGSSADVSPPMSPTTKTPRKQKKSQNRPPMVGGDEIEIMKERATNKTCFIYTKIPEIPLCVTYKGEKEKNIEDVEDVRVNLPTLEYHNKTWSWHDLLMEIKKESQKALVSQAIKQKLGLSRFDAATPREELGKSDGARDKSKYIFGMKVSAPNPVKASKKLLGKLGRKTGTKEEKVMAANVSHQESEGAIAAESYVDSDFASTFKELKGCRDNPDLQQQSFQSGGCNEQEPTDVSP